MQETTTTKGIKELLDKCCPLGVDAGLSILTGWYYLICFNPILERSLDYLYFKIVLKN
jgi:hypothetical protein